MRELKFRVWHVQTKTLSTRIYTIQDLIDLPNQAGKSSADFDEYIWMQYTGLKDKNGKEIYEGDILVWLDSYIQVHRHEVKWSDQWACWDFPMLATDSGKRFYEFEVIGNIYERAI